MGHQHRFNPIFQQRKRPRVHLPPQLRICVHYTHMSGKWPLKPGHLPLREFLGLRIRSCHQGGLHGALLVGVSDLRPPNMVQHLLGLHLLEIVDHYHLPKRLSRIILKSPRQLIQKPLIQRSKVINNKDEVVCNIEDQLKQEMLGGLPLNNGELVLHLYRGIRAGGV